MSNCFKISLASKQCPSEQEQVFLQPGSMKMLSFLASWLQSNRDTACPHPVEGGAEVDRVYIHETPLPSKYTKSFAASRTIHDLLDSRAAEHDEEEHCLSDSQGLSFPQGQWRPGIGGQEAQPSAKGKILNGPCVLSREAGELSSLAPGHLPNLK